MELLSAATTVRYSISFCNISEALQRKRRDAGQQHFNLGYKRILFSNKSLVLYYRLVGFENISNLQMVK